MQRTFTNDGGKSRYILIGNFDCDNYWRDESSMQLPYIDFRGIKPIIQSLDELFIFLGHKEDVVVLRQKPDSDFISYLKNIGVEIPRIYFISLSKESLTTSKIILSDKILLSKLKNYVEENANKQINTYLCPYGITELENDLSRNVSAKLVSASETSKYFNDKLTLIDLRLKYALPSPEYVVCMGKTELMSKGLLFVKKYGCAVIKERYESGGAGIAIVHDTKQYINLIKSIPDSVDNTKPVIIEKWYPHYCSHNYQYIVSNDSITRYAYSTQIVDSKGRIVGSEFDFANESLLKEINAHYTVSSPLVEEFLCKGYRGVVGFDSLMCLNNQAFPIIDINCRVNLSSVFYEITRKYFPCRYALFFYIEYVLKEPIPFVTLLEQLGSYAFSPSKKEGVIILNYASLNINVITGKGKVGRVFYAIIANNKSRATEIYKKVSDRALA